MEVGTRRAARVERKTAESGSRDVRAHLVAETPGGESPGTKLRLKPRTESSDSQKPQPGGLGVETTVTCKLMAYLGEAGG